MVFRSVPSEGDEGWWVSVHNTSDTARRLDVVAFCQAMPS
jgi:hypothetical protein